MHALATPLITRPDGEKFGKSEGSTLWLDPELTSPFAFYQWFLNVDDSVIGTYLRVFSFRSHEEIEALEAEVAAHPESRGAQRALAAEVTELVHGADATRAAIAASEALFGGGDLRGLDAATLEAAFADLPRATLAASNGLPPVLDLFVASGLSESRGQARRVLGEGGAYVNNVRVADPAAVPDRSDLLAGRWLLLRRGKRNLAVAEVTRLMGLAFVTGAVASGFTAAGLTALLIWVATVLTGSSDPWSIAPWLVTLVATLVAIATYVAEKIAYRLTSPGSAPPASRGPSARAEPRSVAALGTVAVGRGVRDDLVGDVVRHLRVVVELPAEAAAALGDRAQLRGVVEHLGLRDLRLEVLHALDRVDPQHVAPLRGDLAHHVAHEHRPGPRRRPRGSAPAVPVRRRRRPS